MNRTGRALSLRALALSALAFAGAARADPPVEVLHWWTAGGEALAVAALRDGLKARGYDWLDSSVDGGGDMTRQVLAARTRRHADPDVVQVQRDNLRLGAAHYLVLDRMAEEQHWNAVVPAPIREAASYDGHWIATPVDIHRSNWIWANKRIFDSQQLAPPRTFEQLMAVARQLSAAGIRPFAFGGEPWQQALLFENAAFSVGGAAWYRRALLRLAPDALRDDRMTQVFEQLAQLRSFADSNSEGRSWNLATAMVSHGDAAMQIMGDWAKGEFTRAGQVAGREYICFAYPGTEQGYQFAVDLFAMSQGDATRQAGELAFAATAMDPEVQRRFNLAKGSIPARSDVALTGFDACALKSAADFRAALARGTLVMGSSAEIPERVRDAISRSIAAFFTGRQSAREGAQALALAVQAARKPAPR